MSAKYARKKKNPLKWVLLTLLAVAIVAAVVIALFQKKDPAAKPEETTPATNAAAETGASVSAQQSQVELPLDLGNGLVITDIASYAGLYLEDGSDEPVSEILMIQVVNTAEEDLQLAQIDLQYANATASFMVTNLPVGRTAVVLEQNRMTYRADAPQKAEVQNVAFLPEFEMHADALEINALEGAINVKNVSGGDIQSDIFIYYKNVVDGIYYGGITYRIRIEGGLKAGEIRQLMSTHFKAEGSEILMVSFLG